MELKNLSKALVKAQASMQAASKDSRNPHFKSSYSSLTAVIDAIRPALSENGLGFVQKLHTADGGVSVETVLVHESGEQMSCGILFIPATKHDAQGFGSAISYGKRYSLQAAVGLSSEDDDGTAASKSYKPTNTAPKPVWDIEVITADVLKAATIDDLNAVYAKWISTAAKGSPEAKELIALCKARKEDLGGGQ